MQTASKCSSLARAAILFATLGVAPVVSAQTAADPRAIEVVKHGTGNPYLPLWEHVPDGEPRVFEDPDNPGKMRAYIIGSHDVRFGSYCGPDIRMWSASTDDLGAWRDEGPIFTFKAGNQWDVMYAPDLVEVKGKDGKKTYYLYPHSRGPNREAMVAKGDRPNGPFTPINLNDEKTRTVPGSVLGFDPAVFVDVITDPKDPDFDTGFRAYGYWGFQRSVAGQLDQKTMYSLRPDTKAINPFIPAARSYGVARDPEGTEYPALFPGQNLGAFNFFEASSIRKIGNKYLYVYSGYSGPDYGLGSSNSTLRYAYGDTALGPWKTGGVLVDSRAPVPNKDGTALVTTNAGHNTHGSVQLIGDQYYVFYHRPPRGFGFARQAMVAPVKIDADEKSVADGGAIHIRAYDPYAKDNLWTAKASNGQEYMGAEVTSEGFHIFGLDPYQYYSAGYASYLSNPGLMQDTWDNWDNNMPVAGVQNNNVVGFKYFGFGGLDKDSKGIKAFGGAKAGNKTTLEVFLKPRTSAAFKVNVWIDGPWDNDTWKGKKIGEISVPENAAQDVAKFSADVASSVEGLTGKHAIYLVAEGEGGPLFDLVGLGFASATKPVVRWVPPTVTIKVDGTALEIPATPIRSTNANGIVDVSTYQVSIAGDTVGKVEATASDPAVKLTVNPVDADGVVMVDADYHGLVKKFRVSKAPPAPAPRQGGPGGPGGFGGGGGGGGPGAATSRPGAPR